MNINASPFDINKIDQRKELVKGKAKKLNVPIVYLNMVGGQDELVFDGGSFVVDKNGEFIYVAPQFKEDFFTFDIELEVTDNVSESSLSLNEKNIKIEPLLSSNNLNKTESMYSALELGLSDYVTKNKFEKLQLDWKKKKM